ncbi:unnamed protein product [Bursaphelenchus xylophilus]|uniref:(pine wood nematode) hypothetical protein n=1 Tax=Bursaphelenchus xylophilus TaxID=6326 RepID=A0A811LXK7_BURXY|nr:unnamed protein product [Bursaphelenchus xylophilus]CAG9126708.1 unnamed protein product [Bursaphelenchus xylophilus]
MNAYGQTKILKQVIIQQGSQGGGRGRGSWRRGGGGRGGGGRGGFGAQRNEGRSRFLSKQSRFKKRALKPDNGSPSRQPSLQPVPISPSVDNRHNADKKNPPSPNEDSLLETRYDNCITPVYNPDEENIPPQTSEVVNEHDDGSYGNFHKPLNKDLTSSEVAKHCDDDCYKLSVWEKAKTWGTKQKDTVQPAKAKDGKEKKQAEGEKTAEIKKNAENVKFNVEKAQTATGTKVGDSPHHDFKKKKTPRIFRRSKAKGSNSPLSEFNNSMKPARPIVTLNELIKAKLGKS